MTTRLGLSVLCALTVLACGAAAESPDAPADEGALHHTDSTSEDTSYRSLLGKWKVVEQAPVANQDAFENNIRSLEFTDEETTAASSGAKRRVYHEVVRVELDEEGTRTRDESNDGKYLSVADGDGNKKGRITWNVSMNSSKIDWELTSDDELHLTEKIYDGKARKERSVVRKLKRD